VSGRRTGVHGQGSNLQNMYGICSHRSGRASDLGAWKDGRRLIRPRSSGWDRAERASGGTGARAASDWDRHLAERVVDPARRGVTPPPDVRAALLAESGGGGGAPHARAADLVAVAVPVAEQALGRRGAGGGVDAENQDGQAVHDFGGIGGGSAKRRPGPGSPNPRLLQQKTGRPDDSRDARRNPQFGYWGGRTTGPFRPG